MGRNENVIRFRSDRTGNVLELTESSGREDFRKALEKILETGDASELEQMSIDLLAGLYTVYGDIVDKLINGAGLDTPVYARDEDGNVIETIVDGVCVPVVEKYIYPRGTLELFRMLQRTLGISVDDMLLSAKADGRTRKKSMTESLGEVARGRREVERIKAAAATGKSVVKREEREE